MKIKQTKDQKQALKKAEKLFDLLTKENGIILAKWSMNKILAGQTEKQKLIKERTKIEARLMEIDKQI